MRTLSVTAVAALLTLLSCSESETGSTDENVLLPSADPTSSPTNQGTGGGGPVANPTSNSEPEPAAIPTPDNSEPGPEGNDPAPSGDGGGATIDPSPEPNTPEPDANNGGSAGSDTPPTDGGAGGTDGGGGTATNGGAPSGTESWTPEFQTVALSADFISEGAAVADIDGDDVLDLVTGPNWYKGPDFALGGTIAPVTVYDIEDYSLFFLTFTGDVNGDDLVDVIAVGDAGGGNGTGTPNAHWYENPGPENLGSDWTKRPIFNGLVSNESPAYANLVGGNEPELVFMTDGQLGYAAPSSDPNQPWAFTPISGDEFNTPYVHGLGVGDVSGDGLMDVIEAGGYWEQLAGGGFERHEVNFTEGLQSSVRGGAQMYVTDVDGDGDGDVITSLSGHGYGLSWFEQIDADTFAAHGILSPSAMGESFSQLHAVGMADLNGDGLLDIVTGKRYYAHRPPQDPGGTDPAVLYWFELTRNGEQAEFVPRAIHDDSGVGCNFTIQDVDGNGRPDVFTSSKKGTFLHLQ